MSKEVKRYAPWDSENGMVEHQFGNWVDADDFEALLAENESLRGLYKMHQQTETREMRDLRAERDQQTKAAGDVLAERRRQVEREGWTPAHDDLYDAAELPRAAAAYVLNGGNDEAPCIWPFHSKWWKPRDARANYVRAAALLLAEIERIDRAALQGEQP